MTVIVGMNNIKIIILTTKSICYLGNSKWRTVLCDYLKYITLRVPCTSQVGCLSPSCPGCLGSSECANSLIGIVSWQLDDGQ